MQRSTRRRTILFATALAAVSMVSACRTAEPAKGLVLGLQMDLVVPVDTDHVAVYVTLLREGRRINQPPAEVRKVSEATFSFVASLVLESREANDQVQVRFVAYDAQGGVRAMREARTSIPNEGTRLLRLPLLWINEGLVTNSGAPLASSSSSVELASSGPLDVTDDVFARLSDGCPADFGRGNDGLCHSIDVKLEELEDLGGGVHAAVPTCLDLDTCFLGPEVERFDLAQRSGCELPIRATASTEKPALLLSGPRTGGFSLRSTDGTGPIEARPIDDALYGYDVQRNVILLGEALCQKIERDGITTAIVSAKCTPKDTNVPVCGALKQAHDDTKQPTNAGVFVDDTTPDEGGTDAGPDSSPDAEGGTPLPPRIDAVAQVAMTGVYSFTARGEAGTLWVAGYNQVPDGPQLTVVQHGAWATPNDSTSVDFSELGPFQESGKLIVDQAGEAFYIQDTVGNESGHHRALGVGAAGVPVTDMRLCPTGGCAVDADASACNDQLVHATVGNQNGETVLLLAEHDAASGDQVRVTAGVRRGPAGCFEPRTTGGLPQTFATDGIDPGYLSPAVSIGGHLVSSLVFGPYDGAVPHVLVDSSDTQVTGRTLTGYPDFENIASLGSGRAAVASREFSPDGEMDRVRLHAFEAGFTAPVVESEPLDISYVDEMFGGDNVACVQGPYGFGAQSNVVCVLRDAGGALTKVDLRLSARTGDDGYRENYAPHIYSDENYLYVGQYCGEQADGRGTFEVRGVTWQSLQTPAALAEAFYGLCGGDKPMDPG